MDFGISTFVTDETPAPGDIGRLVEERGFTALFVAEHPHMPHDTVRRVDRKYYRSLDPFVTLTAAAAATTTLRVGFGIMLLAQRDPITTAKAVASLDHVSGGRGGPTNPCRYGSFERIMPGPKPVQKPHPPLWVGGAGEKVLERVLRYGD